MTHFLPSSAPTPFAPFMWLYHNFNALRYFKGQAKGWCILHCFSVPLCTNKTAKLAHRSHQPVNKNPRNAAEEPLHSKIRRSLSGSVKKILNVLHPSKHAPPQSFRRALPTNRQQKFCFLMESEVKHLKESFYCYLIATEKATMFVYMLRN